MEKKIKHLEFIQTVVGRLAKNSFLLKGWSITIVAAIFTFSARTPVDEIICAYFLVAVFWIKDGYYLWQERLYRKLYDHTRKLKDDEIDFNLDVQRFYNEKGCKWTDAILSKTLLWFYVPLLVIVLVIFYFLK